MRDQVRSTELFGGLAGRYSVLRSVLWPLITDRYPLLTIRKAMQHPFSGRRHVGPCSAASRRAGGC